jgi:hypothetical protein
VKLGRVEFFVSEIKFNGDQQTVPSKSRFTASNRSAFKFVPEQHSACKICLEDAEDKANFLFNPCKCAGSCGTVHIECLQQWIEVKVKKETIGGTIHLNYEKFECEICKTELPMVIDANGRQIEMLPIHRPTDNYVILEGACDKTQSVMLIQNPGDGIKLGRGHECEIRITDISVSRNHANIRRNHDGFYIYDNNSKFGTLVKSESLFDFEVNHLGTAIQIGRTLVEIQVKKKWG